MSTEAGQFGQCGQSGLVVVNIGTPRSPSVRDVRSYLREFLSDRAVVDLPRVVWWPILEGYILPFRAPRSAALYREIWTAQGSPLMSNSRAIAEGLAARLGPRWCVRLSMRVGEPRLESVLAELCALGVERIVLLPLFPQFSKSTTGSITGAAERALAGVARAPALRVVPPWFEDTGYIRALARTIRAAAGGQRIDQHVFSFHGLPVRQIERGDPYRDQCARTAELLARELGLAPSAWSLAFQSRFGREPWLEPAVEELVRELGLRGQSVLVATPGFAADCLETLEEIGLRLAASFRAAGGTQLVVVPCLNAEPVWLDELARIVTGAGGAPSR